MVLKGELVRIKSCVPAMSFEMGLLVAPPFVTCLCCQVTQQATNNTCIASQSRRLDEILMTGEQWR